MLVNGTQSCAAEKVLLCDEKNEIKKGRTTSLFVHHLWKSPINAKYSFYSIFWKTIYSIFLLAKTKLVLNFERIIMHLSAHPRITCTCVCVCVCDTRNCNRDDFIVRSCFAVWMGMADYAPLGVRMRCQARTIIKWDATPQRDVVSCPFRVYCQPYPGGRFCGVSPVTLGHGAVHCGAVNSHAYAIRVVRIASVGARERCRAAREYYRNADVVSLSRLPVHEQYTRTWPFKR